MTDPVIRDLNRHLDEVSAQDEVDHYAEELQEQDAHLDREEARQIAERELRELAEEAALEAALDARAEAMYDDYYRGG